MTIIGWLFYRDNPEDCRLVMDGVSDEAERMHLARKIPETRKEFTRREALQTYAFWVFTLSVATVAMIITGATFHIASIGREAGLNREAAYALFLPMGIFSVAANLVSGYISDRVRHKWQVLGMMAGQFIAIVGLIWLSSPIGQILFVAGQGTAGGIFSALATVYLPRFFGRKHLGEISGVNFSQMVFASAIGPIAFSFGQSLTGSYREAFLISLVIPFLLMLLSLRLENPQESV
jgi:MFS family permease